MCTGIRFTDDKNNMYFGRNLDWSTGYGQKIVVTPKGYQYKPAFADGPMNPKYAVIGMGIVEENTPLYFDCANEAGLAIAGLNFPGYAEYEKDAVSDKTNIAAYEFPLWVVANFTTVDEVEEALKNVAIIAKPINEKYPVSMLHWLIGDKDRSIVVEYTKDGMEIFHNDPDVLTNQPGYAWHQENMRNYLNLMSLQPKKVTWGEKTVMTPFGSGSLMRGIPGDYYSPSRFVRVAYLNTHYPEKSTEEENVARLFHTLAGVAMIDGAAAMADGNFEKTVYTGGYSAATKTYYYNTYEDPAIKSAKLDDYDVNSAGLITA
ncbi:choloylglycine hydrolase [Candidatus Saccharibacteria bacterium]|nr:choloylglycine hydrolase [Candidatus Saccharibacteria bacterium]